MFADSADRDGATGVLRFGADEAAIITDFCDGIADIVKRIGDIIPVCVIAAGGLRSAFENVSGQASSSKLINIIAFAAA